MATLATAAARAGARLLHLSTDFVFDGKANRAYLPTDQTNPLSVYGASKLAGERHVLKADGGHRAAHVLGVCRRGHEILCSPCCSLMRERTRGRVVCDQIGAPTWAGSAARAIWGLIETASAAAASIIGPISGVASWYDFAVAIQDEAQARGLLNRAAPVLPIPSAEYPTRAHRPAFSVLDTAATRATLNIPGHHWRHSLRNMLDELRAA